VILGLSTHDDFLIYSGSTWEGDSGSAVLLLDGVVVGVHVMGVNQIRDRISRKASMEERLNEVEQSVDSITKCTSSGALAVYIGSNKFVEARILTS